MEWNEACKKIIYNPRDREGIGRLGEKTVHAVLKYYLESDESCHEQKVEGFYADILQPDGGIIEIQTRNFERLRRKLEAFLPEHPVEVVYPIPYRKDLIWIREDGTLEKPRRSPKKGRAADAYRELYRIRQFLNHPNFSLHLIFLDVEEYRLLNGWSKDKKKGSTRYDRIPLELVEEQWYCTPDDYRERMMPALPEEFTVKEFRQASKVTERMAGYAIGVLRELGVIEQTGVRGRAFVYRKKQDSCELLPVK